MMYIKVYEEFNNNPYKKEVMDIIYNMLKRQLTEGDLDYSYKINECCDDITIKDDNYELHMTIRGVSPSFWYTSKLSYVSLDLDITLITIPDNEEEEDDIGDKIQLKVTSNSVKLNSLIIKLKKRQIKENRLKKISSKNKPMRQFVNYFKELED